MTRPVQRHRRLMQMHQGERQRIVGFERRTSGKQVIHANAKRVEIAPHVNGFPLNLLGTHVARRAECQPRLRQTGL